MKFSYTLSVNVDPNKFKFYQGGVSHTFDRPPTVEEAVQVARHSFAVHRVSSLRETERDIADLEANAEYRTLDPKDWEDQSRILRQRLAFTSARRPEDIEDEGLRGKWEENQRFEQDILAIIRSGIPELCPAAASTSRNVPGYGGRIEIHREAILELDRPLNDELRSRSEFMVGKGGDDLYEPEFFDAMVDEAMRDFEQA